MTKRPWLLLSLAFSLFCLPAAAQDERIRSFDSQITLNMDGSLLVKETIVVNSEGITMKHGIYRDFPVRYKDHRGISRSVPFAIVSLTRDGSSEPYHTSDMGSDVRTYFGSADKLLPDGEHTYEFTYKTSRQLGFFKDNDELYFNATGNEWDYHIDVATATLILPAQIRDHVQEITAWRGVSGSKQHADKARDGDNNPTFRTGPLAPKEGLTFVVTWPKGLIAEPTKQEKAQELAKDNRGILVGLGGLVLVVLYYLLVWTAVGKDPAPGTIVPIYDPPDSMSPGAMRYLERMGFDEKVFTADIMSLAAKGYLTIQRDESKTYQLIPKKDAQAAEAKLSPDEKALARKLFEDGRTLELKNENHSVFSAAKTALQMNLKAAMEKRYFVTNARYMWPAVVLTGITGAAVLLMVGTSNTAVSIFMTVWLTGWSVGVFALLSQVIHAWRCIGQNGIAGVAQAIFITLFSVPFVGGECFGIVMLYLSAGLPVFFMIISLVGVNILFHQLLKAPTSAGRQLLDRIDGFKMYLKAVDADRLRKTAPPDKTPQLFERMLPFALALGVEHSWAEQFSQVLAQTQTAPRSEGTGYSPSWYRGGGVAAFSAAEFASSFSSSFSSAVSSASTAPGSSSGGGGGGSSGGGGGGGGGGGW